MDIAQPTPRQLRQWTITLCVASAAAAAALVWRQHRPAAAVAGALGVGVLLLTAFPKWQQRCYRGWMKLGLGLSRITTPLWMLAIYICVMVPAGLIARLLGHDPMQRRRRPTDSYWQDLPPNSTMQRYYEPY